MQLIVCVLILLEGLYECWTRVMEQTSMGKAVSRFSMKRSRSLNKW